MWRVFGGGLLAVAGTNREVSVESQVHAFVTHGGALLLWVEKLAGHTVVTEVGELGELGLPDSVIAVFGGRQLRKRGVFAVATPKGRVVQIPIHAVMFNPSEAVAVLERLCEYVGMNPQGEHIGPELLYLCDAFAMGQELIRAGRVMVQARREDGQWYPRWGLATAGDHFNAVDAFAEAMPPVLQRNGMVFESWLDEMVHWSVVHSLQQEESFLEEVTSSFVHNLVQGLPDKRVDQHTVAYLNDWNQSARWNATQCVLMLAAPESAEVGESEALEAGAPGADRREPFWRLSVALASNGRSAEPVEIAGLPGEMREFLAGTFAAIVELWPELQANMRPLERWATQGVWIPNQEAQTGDYHVDRLLSIPLDREQVFALLDSKAQALRHRGIEVLIPAAWRARTPRLSASIAPSLRSGADAKFGLDQLLDFEMQATLDGKALQPFELENLLQEASKIVEIHGEYVFATSATLRRCRQWLQELTETEEITGQVSLRDVLEADAKQPIMDTRHEFRVLADGWLERLLHNSSDVEYVVPEVTIPNTVVTALRDHQRRGLNWLAERSRNQLGAILADDMGLGKSLQVLALIAWECAESCSQGPTLIIAPTSVVGAWQQQIQQHVPSLAVLNDHADGHAETPQFCAQAKEVDVVLTTYGKVARNPEKYQAVAWGRVVADEAQHIKNPRSKQSRAVRSIPAPHHIALTGTPVENGLGDLYAIMDFANPGIFGSEAAFFHRFGRSVERLEQEDTTSLLRGLVNKFLLRREKNDPNLGLGLPTKTEIVESVPLSAEQAALYQSYVSHIEQELAQHEGTRTGLVLAALTKFKQICNHPVNFTADSSGIRINGAHRSRRVERMYELLHTALAEGQKIVIFTQYPSFAEQLIPDMEQEFGLQIPLLSGSVSRSKRNAMVNDFQNPQGNPVLMLSVRAGGTGITLTQASVVIHLDRWWNPAVEDQATDRAYRIGQERDVSVYKFVTEGTIDERIHQILEEKRQLASDIVTAGETWITHLDDDELKALWALRKGSEQWQE